jgi:glycine/D-amino acid oxidase-like deaminating enzyme
MAAAVCRDVVVLGCGIAGASVAFSLAQRGLSVAVLEAEKRAGVQ